MKVNDVFKGAWLHLEHYSNTLREMIHENSSATAATGALGLLLQFLAETYEVDLLLLILLFGSITCNTASGAYLAKKNNTYDFRVLKNGVLNKLLGYFILIIGLLIIICALFVAGIKEENQLIPVYYLNIFMVFLLLSLCLVEFKSVLDNLEKAGVQIPFFVRKATEKIKEKIEDLSGKE